MKTIYKSIISALLFMSVVLMPQTVSSQITEKGYFDIEELACRLAELLWKYYPQTLKDRYGIDVPKDMPGYQLIEEMGRKRGYLLSRGEIHTERMSKVLLDEYRSGKLGHFTLEMPEDNT